MHDEVVVATSGFKTVDVNSNDDFLILKNGTQYRGTAGSKEYAVLDFETYAVRLKQRAKRALTLPVKAQSSLFLLDATNPAGIGELQWRIAKVTMLPILMLFALSFSSISYRKNRFPGMLAALLVYFAYSNILGLAVALARRGELNPYLASWYVHFAFLVLAIYLFRRRSRNQRLIPGLRA